MPTLREIAIELRRAADALEKGGDTKVCQPYLSFYCERKDEFLAVAAALPRPVYKEPDESQYALCNLPWKDGVRQWDSRSVDLTVKIARSKICKLVKEAQPAQYECEPLLSDTEEESLVQP